MQLKMLLTNVVHTFGLSRLSSMMKMSTSHQFECPVIIPDMPAQNCEKTKGKSCCLKIIKPVDLCFCFKFLTEISLSVLVSA
jgi:hypothetical protein